MDFFSLISGLVPSAFSVLVVVLVLVFVHHQRKANTARPQVVRQPSGQYLPLGAPGAPPARWNVRVFPPGDLVGEWGQLSLADGQLSFTPEELTEPRFVLPMRSLQVQHRGMFRLGRADLHLWLPDGTRLGMIVSREKINKVIDNDFKEMRELNEAHNFVAALAANGALVRSR